MAMSALEIASVFKIINEASPTFVRIAEDAQRLSLRLKEIFGEIDKSFGTTFKAMGTGIGEQIVEVGKLRKAWEEVGAAAKTASKMAGPNPRNILHGAPGSARGSSGHGGLSYRPPTVDVPGVPGHLHGGTPGLVAAGVGGYSIYEAVKMEDTASRGLASVFPEGLPKDFGSKRDQLIQKIVEESQTTGLPLDTVAKMALKEIKGNANMPWDQRMKMMPLVIETAAREAYIKDTDPVEATEAFVGQLHQIKAFTPDEIEKYGPMIAYFASKDPNSLKNIGRSGAYHTPIGTTMLGIPIEQDLAAQTVLDRTGVGGKSGTWLREMVTRAAKPAHDKHFQEKVLKLQEFGLADAQGNPTWMTDGHYDEQKLLHILHDKLQGMPIEDRAAKLKSVFGDRGSGAVAMMTDDALLKQYDDVLAEARGVASNEKFWKEQNSANPAQAFKSVWVDMQTVMLDIGTKALPPVVAGLHALDDVLKRMGPKGQSGAVVGAAAGGVAGFVAGGVPGAVAGGVAGGALGGDMAKSNRMVGGGLLGAVYDAYRLLNLGLGSKAKADELASPFSDRFGSWPTPSTDTEKPQKQSYNVIPSPNANPRPIVNTTNIALDGNMLATAVAEKLANIYENSPNSPTSNDLAYFDANGGQMAG